MDGLPLAPNPVGIGRLIRDAPVHIPEARVACGFEEKTDDHEVGVPDAVRRKVMSGEEGLEGEPHTGGILEGFCFLTDGANKLGEWDALRRRRRLSSRLGICADAEREGKWRNRSKEEQAQQRLHRNR